MRVLPLLLQKKNLIYGSEIVDHDRMMSKFIDVESPDLDKYVTDKAVAGLFSLVANEEKLIRDNPAARATELLKRVFSKN